MRWDKSYKTPEVINDPVIIPAYGVTDEERARWNAKQDALKYDARPTPYSDNHMISGAIYNALEEYKVTTVESCRAYYEGVAGGLAQTRQIVTDAAERATLAEQNAAGSADAAQQSSATASAKAIEASTAAYNAKNSENSAEYSAINAAASVAAAQEKTYDSEAWAIGTRDGVPIDEEDPAYHNNSKYYAELGSDVIDDEVITLYNTWSSSKLSTELNGKADLESGKVPASQLPSYVDDVLEYASVSEFPATGESGKIYIAIDTGLQYRWSGSDYAVISESLALGETASTAYAGNKGKQNADNITALQNSVSGIQDVIPSTATASNKLATETDLPTTLAGLSDDATHRLVTDTEKSNWDSKADGVHTHDDRYYTETEINTMFNGVTFTTSNNEVYINW